MATQTIVSQALPLPFVEQQPWYAVRTKSRHEKVVCKQLEADSLESYLPSVQQSRQWSDRTKVIDSPLFPGYVFVRVPHFPSMKVQILRKVGVIGFVGNDRGATPIPDSELNGVRCLLMNRIPHASHPYLKVGQRIRVTDVLELLAAGASFEEIIADYPFLEREDILAALDYAAYQTDHVVLPTS